MFLILSLFRCHRYLNFYNLLVFYFSYFCHCHIDFYKICFLFFSYFYVIVILIYIIYVSCSFLISISSLSWFLKYLVSSSSYFYLDFNNILFVILLLVLCRRYLDLCNICFIFFTYVYVIVTLIPIISVSYSALMSTLFSIRFCFLSFSYFYVIVILISIIFVSYFPLISVSSLYWFI